MSIRRAKKAIIKLTNQDEEWVRYYRRVMDFPEEKIQAHAHHFLTGLERRGVELTWRAVSWALSSLAQDEADAAYKQLVAAAPTAIGLELRNVFLVLRIVHVCRIDKRVPGYSKSHSKPSLRRCASRFRSSWRS